MNIFNVAECEAFSLRCSVFIRRLHVLTELLTELGCHDVVRMTDAPEISCSVVFRRRFSSAVICATSVTGVSRP